ncbi:MAG: hypothetical protein WD766_11350 [Gemmatimonadota bacterium]
MSRPNGWLVGSLAVVLLVVVTVQPEARTPEAGRAYELPLSPSAPFALEGCASVAAREEYEKAECLQAIRLDLLDGRIDLDQALHQLELCGSERPDLANLQHRRVLVRADLYRARLSFGETLDANERAAYDALLDQLDRRHVRASSGAVATLRSAGVAPSGITASDPLVVLARLASDESLRSAFREVFGGPTADDLEAILTRDLAARPAAVVLGRTAIIPNLPPPSSVSVPGVTSAISADELPEPLVVDALAYEARIASDLRGLELARLGYLESAAIRNQRTGSVRSLLARFRSGEAEAAEAARLEADADRGHDLMTTRVATLETRLGIDPLLVRMAGESAGIAVELNRACHAVALKRQRWVRRGAGLVTGLVGAAGIVIATGATGTLIGGITIAAAIEASVGAYLVARSESVGPRATATEERLASLPEDAEVNRFRRPDAEHELLEGGEAGSGSNDFEEWFEDFGEAQERSDLEGEGIEDESGETTELEPRENRIPPILPIDVAEDLRKLPPLLDTREIREMRTASLPEIQERLDEFLALNDPAQWALLSESDEAIRPISLEEMIAEATAALELWKRQRTLHERFGAFFIQAELERLPASRQREVLLKAMGRYTHDREVFEGSADVSELRRRVASRLVTHCRAGSPEGDLVLTACTEETALSILLVAALRDAGVSVPIGSVLGIQAFGTRFEAVLFSRSANEVYSLTKGEAREGVVAPIYHPAIFYYSYLLGHGVVPDIDPDQQLMIALPDRAMPPEELDGACEAEDSGNVVGRAVQWLGSMIGVRRVNDECGDATQRQQSARGGGVDITLPLPRNPLQRGGSGDSGGGSGGGGGGGGGDPLAGAAPRDAGSSGGSSAGSSGADGGASGGGGDDAEGAGDAGAEQGGAGQGSGGAGDGQGGGDGDADAGQLADTGGTGAEADADSGSGGGDPSGASGPSESETAGGSGGFGFGNTPLTEGPDLAGLGEETVRLTQRYERSGDLRVMPWRLREDEGMMTGSRTRVLYADNDRALERFGADDLFITLAPAEVEAQRRMLEADAHPIYAADTRCDAANLPPRRVFRRAAANEDGFRYAYCDQHESMVIFRERPDAESYAALSAPDRPLYLSRLAVERLERFERSREVQRLQQFLRDPNILRDYSKEELFAMVKAAADMIVFQNALESALVQSMNELGPSEIRGYYYDMHRQVLQAPLFVGMADGVYRLNRRLASDPLQSLAWANEQPPLARQEFFDLYHTLGQMMEWPERWATMQQRYGSDAPTPAASDPEAASLDFLQILSDPTRVQVDWSEEKRSDPAIRDRHMQDGVERTPEQRSEPTTSDRVEMQDEAEHQRGGTGGLGSAGDGDSFGPERGQRPLQMLHIRIAPDAGDPDRQRLPDDNQVRPGGTEGRERKQTEESATRQEPLLWLTPHTFIDAVLSTWDGADAAPDAAGRIPPVLRFERRLREVFVRDLRSTGVYENRLRTAMGIFTDGGWLRFEEVRDAMGGSWTVVRARDTGRFSGAYAGNAPINDQDQIKIPNFFNTEGVIIPADLFEPVRQHYTNSILGIFELTREDRVSSPASLESLPVPPGDSARAARASLLQSLETIRIQASEW